jgi:erythronate-4-phosphate dehydrogenase
VAAKAQALGLQVIQNDPPLERFTGDPAYAPLDSVFGADFVTLHVPLVREGPDVTRHLVDRAFLRRIGRGATLLNSSRGEVVDAAALAEALESGAVRDAVLDVWEGEPDISHDLVRLVALATPHIAGYSFDGKLQGTAMVYRAACAFFGLEPRWRLADVEVPTPVPRLSLTASGRRHEEALLEAVKSLYDIEADDANLRAAGSLPLSARGKRFDELRKTYPTRREFQHTVVDCPDVPPRLMAKLRGLGFRTEPP